MKKDPANILGQLLGIILVGCLVACVSSLAVAGTIKLLTLLFN